MVLMLMGMSHTPTKSPVHHTTRELAEALRVCPATIRRWTSSGRIPCIRLSRRIVRYDLAAVIRALSSADAACVTGAAGK